jgi:hypothetical protein
MIEVQVLRSFENATGSPRVSEQAEDTNLGTC